MDLSVYSAIIVLVCMGMQLPRSRFIHSAGFWTAVVHLAYVLVWCPISETGRWDGDLIDLVIPIAISVLVATIAWFVPPIRKAWVK